MSETRDKSEPNPLHRALAQRIALEGPLPLARFMAEALLHPQYGYYATRDPFGAKGDFVTAPEVSQMFGELIGAWCGALWQQMGSPKELHLVELGPGRGTLMADALRATSRLVGFHRALSVHLVDASETLRACQRRTLSGVGVTVSWHGELAEIPAGPVLVVANEFFDALPIHQFERTAEGWRERLVAYDPEGGAFRFVLAPGATAGAALIAPELRDAKPADLPLGAIAETRPQAVTLARDIAGRILDRGGAALLVDYGHARSAPGDTFQAMRRHRPYDPLDDPGEADLTAHVDFARVSEAARLAGARIHGPVEQGIFLLRLGIEERAKKLSAGTDDTQARAVALALRRLIDPAEMGKLFKVLAIAHPALGDLPGFE